jgi:hypothetical protein
MPSSDRLVAALGQRVQAARAERAQGIPEPEPEPLMQPTPRPAPVPPPPAVVTAPEIETSVAAAEPALSGFDEAPAPPEPGPRRGMPLYEERPREAPPPRDQATYQPPDRGALFRSDSRTIEREAPPPAARAPARQDSSLGAVFNRLSAPRDRDRLPDPRNRSRTTPGLGGVFDRLR